ncbi:hypothetical protein SLEP1_g13945 [Rubroshorea leprosula]|uniref:F-box associated beta-propeller type 1 domain-containing protein n=1 Tax=Rubroshorea leprosula TaxID=152421 RepID=A0AAV5IU06_9ROSI|nr:hypothetical protein SLEP1_g13945 [Rubroshorea leprosula]
MCLSKSCYQAISDPRFFHLHLHHSNQSNKQFVLRISEGPLTLQSLSFCHHQLLREPVTLDQPILLLSIWQWEMVGSCNGVLCLTTSPESIHYLGILNPSIKKLKLVLFPILEYSLCPSNDLYTSVDGTYISTEIGFGFDSLTSDFKIVIIFRENYSERWRQVQVYSLRKNSWKVLSNVPNSLYDEYYSYEPQVVVNGAFYWFVSSVFDCFSILMFDFTDETFKEIKMPDCLDEDLGEFDSLGEVKGKLSLLHFDINSSTDVSMELWMMEDSGWVRQFVVNVSQLYEPTCLAMNDEVMLLLTHPNDEVGHILSRDLKTLELTDHGVEEESSRAFTYTPSLALLGEEN